MSETKITKIRNYKCLRPFDRLGTPWRAIEKTAFGAQDNLNFDFLNLAKMSENNTDILALDCETVGVEKGGKFTTVRRSNEFNNLARVSIVNQKGDCIYDKYVKPTQEVKEYRYRNP